jgi:hypothetical protein
VEVFADVQQAAENAPAWLAVVLVALVFEVAVAQETGLADASDGCDHSFSFCSMVMPLDVWCVLFVSVAATASACVWVLTLAIVTHEWPIAVICCARTHQQPIALLMRSLSARNVTVIVAFGGGIFLGMVFVR